MRRLQDTLSRIDGRGYKAYKDLERQTFTFPGFTLHVDHVQADPFAAPSRFHVRVPQDVARFPESTYSNRSRSVALRDYLVRSFHRALSKVSERRGSGASGRMFVDPPGQEVLERSACQVDDRFVEARFFVGLPAAGRRVLGREAEDMLVGALPLVVRAALHFPNLNEEDIWRYIRTCEDADDLRRQLPALGLVAFIADGSILPRRSGIDQRPLEGAVPFESPDSLRVDVELPNRGKMTGMGVQEGVTLIVGGGFHGKSTLLRSLERGVYNHVPGDGRERVVTNPTAVKVRAEDGRSVAGVDISAFIGSLPGGMEPGHFTTAGASGSTSQAANICEALEAGSKLLLVDEDTSATNFMIRDRRMQALVEKRNEPITPFLDQVGNLYTEHGVSSVLVMGGSGDYFDVADTVVSMVEYLPHEVTEEARSIAKRFDTGRLPESTGAFGPLRDRIPMPKSIDPSKGRRDTYLRSRGTRALLIGSDEIDLSHVEQMVEDGQVKAIGSAIAYALRRYIDGKTSLADILRLVDERDVHEKGLDVLILFLPPSWSCQYPTQLETCCLVYFRPEQFRSRAGRVRPRSTGCGPSGLPPDTKITD